MRRETEIQSYFQCSELREPLCQNSGASNHTWTILVRPFNSKITRRRPTVCPVASTRGLRKTFEKQGKATKLTMTTVELHNSGRSRVGSLTKIRFPLSATDASMGVDAENLWAEELKPGVFRIDNIPFYAYGVSYCDVVSTVRVQDRLEFKAVITRGGHSTYRILIDDSEGFESERYVRLWRRLADLGCSCEAARRRWVAIDIPPATDPDEASALLELGKLDGVWSFDEGHCGHPI